MYAFRNGLLGHTVDVFTVVFISVEHTKFFPDVDRKKMSVQGPSEAIIEVSIPMHYFEKQADIDCPICAHRMCPFGKCCLIPVKLSCCEQLVCSACFYKLLARCRCREECREVVGTCPFCREMCRADVVSVFLAKRPACRECRQKE